MKLHIHEPPSARRLMSARLVAMALVVVVQGVAIPGAWGQAAGRNADPLAEVAKLSSEVAFPTRDLKIDAAAGKIFEIGRPRGAPSLMRVVARDLASFKRIGHVDLPGSQSGYGGRLAAVDELGHRLIVLYPYSAVADQAVADVWSDYPKEGKVLFAIGVIDTIKFRLLGFKVLTNLLHAPPQDGGFGNGSGIKAMTYFAPEDKLYVVTEDTTGRSGGIQPGNHGVFLHQLDVTKLLDPGQAAVQDWIYPMPHCGMVLAKPSIGSVLRSGRAPEVFVPCRVGNVLDSSVPGDVGGIVRVTILPNATQADAAAFTSDLFPISGKLQFGLVAIDPVAERILLATDLSSGAPRIWMFDAPSASWIGFVVSPPVNSLAVDAALGRYYGFTDPGFGTSASREPVRAIVGSTRGRDVDQGVLTSFRASATPQGGDALVADRVHHRLFWAGYNDPQGANQYYMVIQDRMPFQPQPAAANPDANTIDVVEGLGTAANFLGAGRAYGSRVRFVGGWRALERNSTTIFGSANTTPYPPTCNSPTGFGQVPALPLGFLPACPSDGTRDVHLARVMRAVLTGGEATAEAVGGDRDVDNTDRDLANWTTYAKDRGGPDYKTQRWPYDLAACADFGGPGQTATGRGATVKCAREKRSVSADARNVFPADFPAPPGFDTIRIGRSWASSTAKRDPKLGIVSVAESEARDIEIGDRIGIGRVWARAETWATGRPKLANRIGAEGRHSSIIEDVWVVGDDGKRQTVCTSPCSPQLVAETLTRVLGARVNVSLPQPDPLLKRGTAGGYEALIAQDPFARLNDVSQNGETDIRLEVPTMVITVFADGNVPSRLVLSLAAVSAESHYGIYKLSRDEPAPPQRRVVAPPILKIPDVSDSGPRVLPGRPPETFFERLKDGVRFVVATPANAVRSFGLWGFLVAPLVLMVRRRHSAG